MAMGRCMGMPVQVGRWPAAASMQESSMVRLEKGRMADESLDLRPVVSERWKQAIAGEVTGDGL